MATETAVREGDVITKGPWKGFTIISIYTRAQAFEDGLLIDVSAMATAIGFRFPVAVTAAAWAYFEEATAAVVLENPSANVSAARMAVRTLQQLYTQIRLSKGDIDRIVLRLTLGEIDKVLVAIVGPGDEQEPVITIMEPGEE